MRTPIWRGITSPYDRAPLLGPQRNGKLGTVQKLFSPSTQAMPMPSVSQTRKHRLEVVYPLLALQQRYSITGQSKASEESHEPDRETYLACE